jgi:hypothetical protein
VQFVGRIMRVMFQNDPNNPANHGYVVSHIGLSNDGNWRDFRDFDLEDQQVFREWLESQAGEAPGVGPSGGGRPRRFDEDMLVHGELLSDFVRQSFLDPNDDRIIDRILDAIIPGIGIPFRDLMTAEQAREMLTKAQHKMLGETAPQAIPVSPQRRRQGARKRLADRPKSVAARVLKDLGLAPMGREVGHAIPEAAGTTNLISVLRLIQKAVNKELGVKSKERNKATADAAETAVEQLDKIGDEVRDCIRKAQQQSP